MGKVLAAVSRQPLVPAVALALVLVILGFPFRAAPARAQSIPPGQEELLATMLGNGARLPDGCSFADGLIDRDVVRATYHCHHGDVVIQLSHPSTGNTEAIVTNRFALRVVSGSPQGDLLGAIEALIRSKESEFAWSMLSLGKHNRGLAPPWGVPRWFFAALLLTLAAASAISAARTGATRTPVALRAALEGCIVAATVVIWLQMRAEPPAHGDTAVDVALARDCINSNGSLCLGHAASAIGLVQGQAFTYALAIWLYFGLSMHALAFVAACINGAATGLLHFAIARRFGGVAWVVSVVTSALAVSMTDYPTMWNPSWFVLPLTVAFLVTLAIAAGGGLWSAFLAGAAFAITAESHVLFGTLVAVAALIFLITARRPVVAATVLLSSFVLTEIVVSPVSSTLNALILGRWVGAHLVPAALVALLVAASAPVQLRLRRAIGGNPEMREAVAVLLWLLTGAVGIGMVLPWAVSRPPQIRYYGGAFPAIGYASAWLLNAATARMRPRVAHALAIAIFAAIFSRRMTNADFGRAVWFMDDGTEVATVAGLGNTSALDIMLSVRPLPDAALREVVAAYAGTADPPLFPRRIVRAVRPQSDVELPDGWNRIRLARGEILTSDIDAWTRPEAAEVCPDPANGAPCMTLTRDDFSDVAQSAGGLLQGVFGLRIARIASRIGEWTQGGTRSLLWKIPLHTAGPDDTREIVFQNAMTERIVAVDGTRWTARTENHAVVERPAPDAVASITVRTPIAGKFEAGVPPMPFELRKGELGVLREQTESSPEWTNRRSAP